jgi:hypothetical protein
MTSQDTPQVTAIGTDGLAFLRMILPPQGSYFAVEITERGIWLHTAFKDIPSLYAHLIACDELGRTMYFAVAAFREPRVWNPNKLNKRTGRKGAWEWRPHSNVRVLKVLIADIDTRESKNDAPYADRAEAYKAVLAFCTAASLPLPLIVSSGGGLHCYWILETELTLEQWGPLARGLKAAMAHSGFHADPARTADASSVLRTPGTHHHKSGRIVEAGEMAGPYPVSMFEHLKQFATEQPVKRFVRKQLSKATASKPCHGQSPIAEAMCADIYDDAPTDPELIRRRCRQFRNFCAAARDRANPDWHAVNRLLAFCKPHGLRYAQDLGAGYRGHDRAATDAWIASDHERARSEITGPTTCRRFEEINPGGCDGCLHRGRINTPIVLGRSH